MIHEDEVAFIPTITQVTRTQEFCQTMQSTCQDSLETKQASISSGSLLCERLPPYQ